MGAGIGVELARAIIKTKGAGTIAQYDSAIRKYSEELPGDNMLADTVVQAAEKLRRYKNTGRTDTQVAGVRAVMGVLFEIKNGVSISKSPLMKAAASIGKADSKYHVIYPTEMLKNPIECMGKGSLSDKRAAALAALAFVFNLRARDMVKLQIRLPIEGNMLHIRYTPKHLKPAGGKHDIG